MLAGGLVICRLLLVVLCAVLECSRRWIAQLCGRIARLTLKIIILAVGLVYLDRGDVAEMVPEGGRKRGWVWIWVLGKN